MFADEPGFVARKMLLAHVLDPLWPPIGGPHANGGEARFQPTLGPVSPAHILPLGVGQHVFGRPRQEPEQSVLIGAYKIPRFELVE